MSAEFQREVLAIVQADVRTARASTGEQAREAAEASLASMVAAPHRVEVLSDPLWPEKAGVCITGPVITGGFNIALVIKPETAKRNARTHSDG
ncbi:hypothetical protein [Methylobacterium brachythecii]|uniref:Uncharacterized protein n=1 Tax=Methylobacterium brachythecii TaxID=1176177 RepID=A0A7W6AQV1_9HYPH|nr:hypothetical protein [Methylobacterium brachythecii]MBB3905580.1 hypothetical protein [Methylobacterium brachythecii]GLS46568.1 hypothetical protein GCM10007884_45620 [Methylobacterium brachythecii]